MGHHTMSCSGLSRRRCLAQLGLLGAGLAVARRPVQAAEPVAADAEAFAGFPGSAVRFAGLAEARQVLEARDPWLLATGPFQRRAVTGQPGVVSDAAFAAFNAAAAEPWRPDQRQRWRRALEALQPAFTALRIPLPAEVLLIATTGRESAGAPYTRANAVMLQDTAPNPGFSDAMLMAHELWHVASRHAPGLASRLYAAFGFEPVAPLQLPVAWAEARIANPDADHHDHALQLQPQLGERRPWVMPLLVASRTALQPGESFFSVMEVRLLEVSPGQAGTPTQAVMREGQPVWHRVDGPHDYLARLGGNTGYTIHPEEALADNIALLATGARVRNRGLLDRIEAVLKAPR